MGTRVRQAWNGLTRAALLVFGGLIVFQSSDALDVWKLAYLGVAVVCITWSVAAVARRWRDHSLAPVRPLLVVSAALATLVALSAPVAFATGTPMIDWLRDAANYALLAAVPFVALDAYWSSERRWLLAIVVAAGAIGTASFMAYWLDRRHIVELPFDPPALSSGGLTAAFFMVLVALALAGDRRRLMWILAAGAVTALFVLVGGRARLALLAVPIPMALVAWPIGPRRLALRLVGQGLTAIIAFSLMYSLIAPAKSVPSAAPTNLPTPAATPAAAPSLPAPQPTPNPLDKRLGTLWDVLANPQLDPSFRERLAQTNAAWKVFEASPVLGRGPGYRIEWVNVAGRLVNIYNLDTPMMVPAKFGFVGVLIFVAWTGAVLAFALHCLRLNRRSWPTIALAGFVLGFVGWLLATPFEDKGFSLALILLIALGLTVDDGAQQPTATNPAPGRVSS